MTWQVAMTTAPRKGVDYLAQTLESLDLAGWDSNEVTLNCEPDSPIPASFPEGNAYHNFHIEGPWPSFKRALFLSTRRPARVYMICQDDIVFPADLRWHLETDPQFMRLIDDNNVISLYTAGPNHVENGGWHQITKLPKLAYGALAYVFPAKVAKELTYWNHSSTSKTKTDHWVGKFVSLNPDREYWTHSPSFIQHVGAISSLTNDPR